MLEAIGHGADDARLIAAWQANISHMRAALGWPDAPVCVRLHRRGISLAFAAPLDQLYSATEVNEWACMAARGKAELFAPGHPHGGDAESALATLGRHAAAERQADLVDLIAAAVARRIPYLLDDDTLSLGFGHGGHSWPRDRLPSIDAVDWAILHGIPTALVTGSNGKTTSVRLLAAMLNAHGLRTAFSCTDGVFFDGESLETGDYSGPAGARTVLRDPHVEAGVLETARGGLLRRGLAVHRADVALVTNISDDHFGEYGIDDLDGLSETKLNVARALGADGLLVLNADDAQLRAHAGQLACRLAWFSLDDDNVLLRAHRASGGTTCGVRDGRLWLGSDAQRSDLGAIEAMPLTAQAHALYNISNIAGASLLANALGISIATISDVLARFGQDRHDNPGRLEQWQFGGIHVLMDYAHNPDGLRGLLSIAQGLRGNGRLGLILGQAGNREEPEIRALAATAASFAPDLVVLKDMETFMRGRTHGEVAGLLRDELLAHGLNAEHLPMHASEFAAVRHALAWARPGDLLVLPVHGLTAKTVVAGLLDRLEAASWQAGQALPES